jgi:hypothetical protein
MNADERRCIEVNATSLPDQATIAFPLSFCQSRPRDRQVWTRRNLAARFGTSAFICVHLWLHRIKPSGRGVCDIRLTGSGELVYAHACGAFAGTTEREGMGMRILARLVSVAAFAGAALLAGAAGAHTTKPCPCRYVGGVAPPGAVVCLEVDGKRSLARCEMVLNNPSWRFLDQPCPVASPATVPPSGTAG